MDDAGRRGAGSHLTAAGRKKVYYPSKKIARLVARQIAGAGRSAGMHPYPCLECGGWHLASGPRRRLEA